MTAKRKRLEALEDRHAARRAQVARLPSSPDLIAWEDLQGKTAAELEDLARRVGVPVPDLTGLSAAELVRLYVDPATWGQA